MYCIDLYDRSLVINPSDGYSNDLDTMIALDGSFKPDAFWLLVRAY